MRGNGVMISKPVLIKELSRIAGRRNVITKRKSMERFCRGYRSGSGTALAVVRPGSLLEQWYVLKACIEADVIVIMQASNTGLTEGSTPSGSYDRDVIILSTTRINGIQLLANGEQIIGFSGATLFELEKLLAPLGRQPHSVIGSSCIGASIVGGVCNNSGGALVERGPSYTELALYAQIDKDGQVKLVNNLGVYLGEEPETVLQRLEEGHYSEDDIELTTLQASDTEYKHRVREIDNPTPARFNADKRRLYGASGCAGKLVVFAVRLDTYPSAKREQVFYIGTNDTSVLTNLRRDMLSKFSDLPVSAEYMHADTYDIARRYGKDTVIFISKLGTRRLPKIFEIKGWIDSCLRRTRFVPDNLSDRLLQGLNMLWPNILPRRMEAFRARFEHYLILKMHDRGIEEAEDYLKLNVKGERGSWFICTKKESYIAELHRFAAAGAAVRYQAIHDNEVEDILPLDIALPRDAREWVESLPSEIECCLSHKLYYGHFFCQVFHHDYIVRKGEDLLSIKRKLLEKFNAMGIEYPAEHNVGHLYAAKPQLAEFYQKCDPSNSLNPGLGLMSKNKHYK